MNLQIVGEMFGDNGVNGISSNVYASNFFLIIDIRARLKQKKKFHSSNEREREGKTYCLNPLSMSVSVNRMRTDP